jgi:uncharacterized SAM-binding protein YcdF (DUF218 family)
MKSAWRRRWWIFAVAGILIVACTINRWTLPMLARWLDVGSSPQKADAVVLLNGSWNTRPLVAAALVHGGWAPKLILNTVAAHPSQLSGAVPPYFDIAMKALDYGGVPRDRVVRLDSAASTTFDEAKAVADYLTDHPAKRLIVVTEGPHSRRARWIFQRVLAGRPVEILMFSGPAEEFDNENWWQCEAGFLYVVSEYFKLFFYCVRYGWLAYELIGAAMAIVFLLAWFWRRRQLVENEA